MDRVGFRVGLQAAAVPPALRLPCERFRRNEQRVRARERAGVKGFTARARHTVWPPLGLAQRGGNLLEWALVGSSRAPPSDEEE